MSTLADHVVSVPDFPKPGILFRDVSPLLRHHFRPTITALGGALSDDEWSNVDVVLGIESRGFILGAALAERQGKAFALVRKQGKLPPPVLAQPYDLEYGTGILEMQPGTGRALLVDDVLATGGTLRAAAELAIAAGYEVDALLVLIDLKIVPDFRWRDLEARSVIRY